jgi:hypothetical protein
VQAAVYVSYSRQEGDQLKESEDSSICEHGRQKSVLGVQAAVYVSIAAEE